MAQISKVWEEANQVIDDFKMEFERRFGFGINVYFRTRNFDSIPKISLQQLLDVVDELLYQDYPSRQLKCSYGAIIPIDNGIRTNNRAYQIVMMRQIFCHIGHNLGYSSSEMGRFLGKDHATVIYSVKAMNNALEVKLQPISSKYAIVKSNLVVKYGNKSSKEQESNTSGGPEGDTEA